LAPRFATLRIISPPHFGQLGVADSWTVAGEGFDVRTPSTRFRQRLAVDKLERLVASECHCVRRECARRHEDAACCLFSDNYAV